MAIDDQNNLSAEALIRQLPNFHDRTLKQDYLNWLANTEPLAKILPQLSDETQALGVVKLALEVDLRLGARLAGAVKPDFQEQTVGEIAQLEVPPLLKTELLGMTKSTVAVPMLLGALSDEDLWVRGSAAKGLGDIGDPRAIAPLGQALSDGEKWVVRSAVEALGKIGTPAAIGPLGEALDLDNEARRVRGMAVEGLGKIGTSEAIGLLGQALEDEDSLVRQQAVKMLESIGSKAVIPVLRQALFKLSGWHENQMILSALLRAMDTPAAIELLKELKEVVSDESHSAHRMATEALVNIGHQVMVEALHQALSSPDSEVRREAVEELVNIPIPAAVPA